MDGHRITDAAAAKKFLLAGKAVFTVRSVETGTRFTYKVKKSKKPEGPRYFVTVRTDTNGVGDYGYLGYIVQVGRVDSAYFDFIHGHKSEIPRSDPKTGAARWIVANVTRGQLPASVEFWHEGCCGRCGRALTVPESIASGFGPECAGKE